MPSTRRSFRSVADALGSLRLAIALLAVLAVICAGATFYESSHGTPAAQRDVYQTGWFAGLLVFLGLNVAASMVLRFPWKLHQSGFVMAHLGVLLILLGSLVSLHFGLDASLALYEGETSRWLETPSAAGQEARPVALPFEVTLVDFKSDKYPGSQMAASYESLVFVRDPEKGSFEHRISMNRPLHHRGYVFFQASFVEGRPMMSVLSVAQAPGLPVVYAGTALLCAGVGWMFYVNPALARRRAALAVRTSGRSAGHLAVPAGLGPDGTDMATTRRSEDGQSQREEAHDPLVGVVGVAAPAGVPAGR